ncbi:type II toxin-antitoxin system RelE family toxin [Phormidesmis priestleyi]
MYEVLLHPDAQKVYVDADKALAKKIARCLQQLEQTPQSHPNIKALKGDYAAYYRYRIGDYRVIYSIDDELVQVFLSLSPIAAKLMNHKSKLVIFVRFQMSSLSVIHHITPAD